ncbi:MAG: PH domain-containing protein [Candidatus Buchananbacteria bacterium]|nr:PH domain-containing protein [Candidatus Buchananbacteria bacterium]
MFNRLIKRINIQDNEIVIDVIRKSLWHFFWPILLVVILLLLPFFLIYPLFLQGTWGVAVFSATLAVALTITYRIYKSYYYTALVITSKRLIDMEQLGFFRSSLGVVLYGKIEDVNYKSKGLFQAVLKIGHVYISFVNDDNAFIELQSIRYPSLAVSKIISQREDYFEAKRQTAGREAIKLLAKIKRRLGEDKFNEIISN